MGGLLSIVSLVYMIIEGPRFGWGAAAITGLLTPRVGMKVTVVLGMALGTTGILLLTGVRDGSGYADFLVPLLLLGAALGRSVSPCTDAIMGAFPERQLGVGGAVNDTSLELGGSLGIAILGSILAGTYTSGLASAIGGRLPVGAEEAAGESIGGAPAVAQKIAATAGPGRAEPLVRAADHALRTPSPTPASWAASSSAWGPWSSRCCCLPPAGPHGPPRRQRDTKKPRCASFRPAAGRGETGGRGRRAKVPARPRPASSSGSGTESGPERQTRAKVL